MCTTVGIPPSFMHHGGYSSFSHAPWWVSLLLCVQRWVSLLLGVQRWVDTSLLTMVGRHLPAHHCGLFPFLSQRGLFPFLSQRGLFLLSQRGLFLLSQRGSYSSLCYPVGYSSLCYLVSYSPLRVIPPWVILLSGYTSVGLYLCGLFLPGLIPPGVVIPPGFNTSGC